MNGNYTFFYVEANLFCVVLFVIMLVMFALLFLAAFLSPLTYDISVFPYSYSS